MNDIKNSEWRLGIDPVRRDAVLDVLNSLLEKYRDVRDGRPAMYIPELAKVDPDLFGISIVTADGAEFSVGDASHRFTIQSISKPIVYGLALEDRGRDEVLSRVGVEPTGESFNSITLDESSNRPKNPMVNAGAIAMASLIRGESTSDSLNRVLGAFRKYINSDVFVDPSVFLSERATGDRNRAIAYLMKNFGMIHGDIEAILDLYFQQCSILMNCRQLALMAATLANGGENPVSGERALQADFIRDVLCVLFTCGLYDSAGDWAYRIGLPAKSGVGGGIMAVVPGRMGIGVFSPLLDETGHSVRGKLVCEELSARFRLSIFEPNRSTRE